MKKYPNVHYSEWAWIGKKFDEEVSNSTSLEDLEKKVVKLIDV
jgi:hypothetical protein